jgi:hypothetical protein
VLHRRARRPRPRSSRVLVRSPAARAAMTADDVIASVTGRGVLAVQRPSPAGNAPFRPATRSPSAGTTRPVTLTPPSSPGDPGRLTLPPRPVIRQGCTARRSLRRNRGRPRSCGQPAAHAHPVLGLRTSLPGAPATAGPHDVPGRPHHQFREPPTAHERAGARQAAPASWGTPNPTPALRRRARPAQPGHGEPVFLRRQPGQEPSKPHIPDLRPCLPAEYLPQA